MAFILCGGTGEHWDMDENDEDHDQVVATSASEVTSPGNRMLRKNHVLNSASSRVCLPVNGGMRQPTRTTV